MIESLRGKIQRRVLDFRAIERAVMSPRFKTVYESVSEAERALLRKCAEGGDVESFSHYYKVLCSVVFETMSLRELRETARLEGLEGWSVKTKTTLILELNRAKRAAGTDVSDASGSGSQ